jgi:hypothetical protein
MDYDPEYTLPQGGTGAVIMYGGDDGIVVYNETWAWDGTIWTQLSTSTVPDRLRSTRMVGRGPARTGDVRW